MRVIPGGSKGRSTRPHIVEARTDRRDRFSIGKIATDSDDG